MLRSFDEGTYDDDDMSEVFLHSPPSAAKKTNTKQTKINSQNHR